MIHESKRHKSRSWMHLGLPGSAASLCLIAASEAGATTYPVPFPYPTIQAGVDAAAFGDTVLVAPGTYTDYESRIQVGGHVWTACVFMKDGVLVKSEAGPEVTTIDQRDLQGPAAIGIIARFLPSDITGMEGFTLQAPGMGNGLYLWLCGGFRMKDCRFRGFGGGLGAGGAVSAVGNSSFEGCDFEDCTAATAGAIWANSGHIELLRCNFRSCTNGAVYIDQGDPESVYVTSALVEDCNFVDNYCAPGEGGGGGLSISVAVGGSIVRGCYFENNFNDNTTGSGALGVGPIGSSLVENCVFVNNGTDGFGGAIMAATFPCMIRNNTFVGNYRPLSAVGGSTIAIFSSGAGTHLENNIIVDSGGAPAIGSFAPGLVATCNVFWNNVAGIGIPLSPTDRVIDPLFCNPDTGDFSLEANSPCLPPFSLGCGLIGAFPQGCGTVSVESKSWGEIKGMYR